MNGIQQNLTLRGSLFVVLMVGATVPLSLACGNDGGDSGAGVVQPPDITGKYNVIVQGTAGCEGDSTWIDGWASGPLAIDGTPSSLTFNFGDGMSFLGGVDSTGGYSFAGDVTYTNPNSGVEAELAVVNTGRFTWDTENSKWEGDGDFTIDVQDSEFVTDTCTVTGPIAIYQI